MWLLAAGAALIGSAAAAQSIDGFPDSRFIEQRERFTPVDGSAVDLRFLIARDAAGQTPRIVNATHAALSLLFDWFGPPPENSLTIGGLPWRENRSPTRRPGIVLAPVRWLAPVRDQSTERAVIGALVRWYWTSTAPTPFEDAVNIYVGTRAIHEILEGSNFAAPRFFGGFVPFPLRSVLLSPPVADPRPRVWGFEELEAPGSSDEVRHTVRALQMFERYAGWPTMLEALSRIRVGSELHNPAAFASVLSDTRGTDMRALVVQCLASSGTFQYALDAMQNQPGLAGLIETTLTIRRLGDEQFAITDGAGDRENAMPLLVRFADGTEFRDYFDGAAPSATLVYSAKTAAVGAWIDPDLMLLLDRNRENNAIVRDPPMSRLGLRLALHWMTWLQNAMLSYTAVL